MNTLPGAAALTSPNPTDVLAPLPSEFRTLGYAPCPTCGRTDFRAVTHRRNHVAKCDLEQLPLRYRDAARALNAERAKSAKSAASAARVAAPHVYLTVASDGDAELYRENAAKAAERRARYGVATWAEEV